MFIMAGHKFQITIWLCTGWNIQQDGLVHTYNHQMENIVQSSCILVLITRTAIQWNDGEWSLITA